MTYNITLETILLKTTTKKPDNLLFIFMNLFLKKSIIEPKITTGCIFVGSSPYITSIASETNKDNIINK